MSTSLHTARKICEDVKHKLSGGNPKTMSAETLATFERAVDGTVENGDLGGGDVPDEVGAGHAAVGGTVVEVVGGGGGQHLGGNGHFIASVADRIVEDRLSVVRGHAVQDTSWFAFDLTQCTLHRKVKE